MLLGAKQSTITHCLPRETGQLPLYFYWFHFVARFWISLLTTNYALLSKINEPALRLAHKKEVGRLRSYLGFAKCLQLMYMFLLSRARPFQNQHE